MASSRYEAPFVLVVDVGSSSVRAGLFDARARPVEGTVSREAYQLRMDRDGTAEGAAQEYLERADRCIDGALRGAGPLAQRIAAVAVDTLAATLLGVDSQGKAITPVYTYADARPRREVHSLRRRLDEGSVYQRTGCPLHMAYAPARLLWLRRTRRKTYQKVYRWMDLGTYLYSRWSGNLDGSMSYSQASWWGLLDRHRLHWDRELLKHLEVAPESLPGLAGYTSAQVGLCPAYAGRWQGLQHLPFFLPVGDGAAANVGSGCLGDRRVALSIGTSGAMRFLLDQQAPPVPPGLWAYRLDRDLTLLGGSFNEGGSILDWARGTLQLPDMDQVEEDLQRAAPDGHGLTVLPFLGGERSPGWTTDASGAVLGLSTSTTPVEILQALLEAVAYRFRQVWDLLKPLASSDVRVMASGGAIIRSPWWLQVMADVLERPVSVLEENEATSRGTAILALHALGVWSSLDQVPPGVGRTYHPDPGRRAIYREAAGRQRRIYDTLLGPDQPVAARLARATPSRSRKWSDA